jgi:Tfp pilus assembly protein PilW
MAGLNGGGWRVGAVSTSTSDKLLDAPNPLQGCGNAGFSLIELLLGLSLALCLALGVAPVWVSFQSIGVREGDETIWALQGRVAVARFERDLRLIGLQRCPFATAAAVLQATSSQMVLLVSTSDSTPPLLVEWELVNGALMRRWGACPAIRPSVFNHSLYADSKTMLENVDTARSALSYVVADCAAVAPVAAADLPLVDVVAIDLSALAQGTMAPAHVLALGRVGR